MLYKKFIQIKQSLSEKNYHQASVYLNNIEKEIKGTHSRLLFDKYRSQLPTDISHKVEPLYIDGYISDYDKRDVIPGISIVSCCMNRNGNLKKALKTWLKLPVDEIIIVDWSSSEPVIDTVSEFKDSRIKILRVDNEPKWILTYGFNVGLRFAAYNKVFKFDADIEVNEDFLSLNQITGNQFVRGYWKSALDEGLDSQVYVNGSFGCYKSSLEKIGYYNELIRTYGWDDSDLYERLASQCGLETKFLDFKSLLHLEQKEAERTENQDVNPSAFLGVIPATEFNNHCNRFIGRTTDYWSTERLQNYTIVKKAAQLWQCERVSDDVHIPYFITEDANVYASIHYMWNHSPHILENSLSITVAAKLVFREYSEKVSFDVTQNLLGLTKNTNHLFAFTDKHTSYNDFLITCVEKARKSNEMVFAIALGKTYKHHSFGLLGSSVEIITMPSDLFKEVVNSRKNKTAHNVDLDHCTYLSEEEYLKTLKQQKRYVYVDAQHGLGNRLRAIASAAAIANKLDRELVIVWEADDHCECDFTDLYDYEGIIIDKSFVLEAEKQMSVFNYMEIEPNGKKDEEIVIDPNKDLYLRAAYTFNSEHSNWNDENEFLRNLIPCKAVESLISDFELENHIAAHIRMEGGAGFEDKSYESMDNWTEEGHDELTKWRQASHFSNFITRIDTLLEQEPQRKLFLATDMPETYKEFERYYGNKLSYLKRDVYDRSKEQIIFGLADAILLSRSQRLLGSTWSSFSELAMRLSTRFSSIEMSGKDF
jgi:hypothetical protein